MALTKLKWIQLQQRSDPLYIKNFNEQKRAFKDLDHDAAQLQF